MNLPSVLRVHVVHHNGKRMRFWFPVCVLWFFLAAIAAFLFPLLMAALITSQHRERARDLIHLLPVIGYALVALRGFKVAVDSPASGTQLQVYVV